MPVTQLLFSTVSTSSSSPTVVVLPYVSTELQLVIHDGGGGGTCRFALNAEEVNATTNSAIPANGIATPILHRLGVGSITLYQSAGTAPQVYHIVAPPQLPPPVTTGNTGPSSDLILFDGTFSTGYVHTQSTANATWYDADTPPAAMIVASALTVNALTNNSVSGNSQSVAVFSAQHPTLTLTGHIALDATSTHQKFLQFSLVDNATDFNYLADIEMTRASLAGPSGVVSARLFDNTGQLAIGTVTMTLGVFAPFTLTATPGTLTFQIGVLTLTGTNRGPFTSPTVAGLLVEANGGLGPAHEGFLTQDLTLTPG